MEERSQTVTLLHVREISAYNGWIFSTVGPEIHGTVLEVGCGIGTYTNEIRSRCGRLLCLDVQADYAAVVGRRFRDDPHVAVMVGRIGESFQLADTSVDVIVCLNVLEHIEDDAGAVADFWRWLRPGGRVVVQVPAHPWLLGSMDRTVGHHRRYTRHSLRQLLAGAGFRPVLEPRSRFVLGIPGWWLYGKVLRSQHVPESSVRVADLLARFSRTLERVIPIPWGLTLLSVGEKEGAEA